MVGPPHKGGNAETLRRYWAEGEGAAKIRWGTPGDFDRCVREVEKYMPGQAKGYCNLLHKRATGIYPATHAKRSRGVAASHLLENAVALGIASPDVLALAGAWDPSKHPRGGKGSAEGGKFVAGKARDAKAAEAQKNTKAAGAYDAGMRGDPKAQAAALKAMSDADLQALSKYAYSFKSSDPKVVALRIQIANALAKRGMNVKDYGALGGGTAKPAAKPAAKKAAAKAPTKKAAAVKKPQAAPTPKK